MILKTILNPFVFIVTTIRFTKSSMTSSVELEDWKSTLAVLKQFRETRGYMPTGTSDPRLSSWLTNQRREHRGCSGIMANEEIYKSFTEILNQYPEDFLNPEMKWLKKFESFCNWIQSGNELENQSYRSWIDRQKRLYNPDIVYSKGIMTNAVVHKTFTNYVKGKEDKFFWGSEIPDTFGL